MLLLNALSQLLQARGGGAQGPNLRANRRQARLDQRLLLAVAGRARAGWVTEVPLRNKACLGQAQTGPSCASGMHMPRQVGADSGPPAAAKHSGREPQPSQVSPLACHPHRCPYLSHSRRCQPSRSPVSAAAISAAARSRACVASCKQSGTTAGRSISAVFGRQPCSWWSSSSPINRQVANQRRQWRAALPQPGGAA